MSTNIAERAVSLLGAGVPQEVVASALGVTPGYISQLLSNENFAAEVTNLKFVSLTKNNARDKSYNEVEDQLIEKLKRSLPLIIRPETILGALKVVNGATRRGHDATANLIDKQNIVQILLPVQIIQKFTTNINNQVIKAGDKDLITIQSSELLKKASPKLQAEAETKSLTYSPPKSKQQPKEEISSLFDNNEILASL